MVTLKRAARGGIPRVAIIGGGAGGIAMGVTCRRLGINTFTIFEQSAGMGGTWWDNTYPGAAVDTSQPFYSFSFSPYDFTGTHGFQPELLAYLEHTAERFRLNTHFKFNTAVTKAVWDEASQSYEVFTADGESNHFEVVVSAVGLLNHPRYPDWPGLEKFSGPKFHTSRWEHQHDLTGKRVAVVGTGSTAAQIIPAIAPKVAQLYVFQRQPGWVVPKGEREFTPAERAMLTRRLPRMWLRFKQGMVYERARGSTIAGTKNNVKAQQVCEAYIAKALKDRPDLIKLVTPDYPFGGKRPVKDSNYYPALTRDNVELVPHSVTSVTETGIIDDTGVERDIDVLVMSTGFQAANFLATYDVIGRNGKSLHELWNGDAYAYLGLTVPGFPNFYMLYGPNTNGAPIMFMHERQTEFVAANLKRMMKEGVTSIEVRESVCRRFNSIVQKHLQRGVASNFDVHNYGLTASGRNVIGWGEGMTVYSLLTRLTPRLSSTARTVERTDVKGKTAA